MKVDLREHHAHVAPIGRIKDAVVTDAKSTSKELFIAVAGFGLGTGLDIASRAVATIHHFDFFSDIMQNRSIPEVMSDPGTTANNLASVLAMHAPEVILDTLSKGFFLVGALGAVAWILHGLKNRFQTTHR